MNTPTLVNASKVIDAIGGTSVTADLCDVEPAAVSQWRKNGIPKAQLKYLRLAKPEVFSAIEQEDPSTDTSEDRVTQ